jgi:hypothetical protein
MMALAIVLSCVMPLLVQASADSSQQASQPRWLPKSSEPSHKDVPYRRLPASTKMVVRMSSDDVLRMVQKQFAGKFDPDEGVFSVGWEGLIQSPKGLFRRMGVYFADRRSEGVHGVCAQEIGVWFRPSGEVAGIYVGEPLCPV